MTTPPPDAGSVTDAASVEMRSNPFMWPKETTFVAPTVMGLMSSSSGVPFGGVGGALVCGVLGSPFQCFAPRMRPSTPPTGAAYGGFPWVPFTSDFYELDVRITPPAGVACGALEVYRITLDADGGIMHALDYPSSTIVPGVQVRIGSLKSHALGYAHD